MLRRRPGPPAVTAVGVRELAAAALRVEVEEAKLRAVKELASLRRRGGGGGGGPSRSGLPQ